jgi:hypothetical protein
VDLIFVRAHDSHTGIRIGISRIGGAEAVEVFLGLIRLMDGLVDVGQLGIGAEKRRIAPAG